MAKLRSLIKLEGTLDGLTFYKTKDGYLVRTKGGVSKQRMATDPAYARTRENGAEFGHCAKMGKVLRRALLSLLTDAKDARVVTRLMQTLNKVKNTDITSLRGERLVSVGLGTPDGKTHLRGFEFNTQAPLSTVLLADFSLDPLTGTVSIADFIPQQHLAVPEGATHVHLLSGYLNLDLDTGIKDLQLSPVLELAIDMTATAVSLSPVAVPTGTGIPFYFLKVVFLQDVNGVLYPLHNGSYNALQLIDVG